MFIFIRRDAQECKSLWRRQSLFWFGWEWIKVELNLNHEIDLDLCVDLDPESV